MLITVRVNTFVNENIAALCVAALYCMWVHDLKPGRVCRQRRESVAGGLQLISLGHSDIVFRYHHSRIKVYRHSREGDLKCGAYSPVLLVICICCYGHNESYQCRILTVDEHRGIFGDLVKGVHVCRDALVNSTVQTGHVVQHKHIAFQRLVTLKKKTPKNKVIWSTHKNSNSNSAWVQSP